MIYEHEVKWTSRPKPEQGEWDFQGLGMFMAQFGPLPPPTDKPVVFPQQRDGLIAKARAYIESRGLNWDLAYSSNWYPALFHGPRIIIPCSRRDGGKFWQGRLIESIVEKESKQYLSRWDSPPGPRGDSVVVLGPSGDRRAVFVVEGPLDALGIAGCGFPAVALLGNKPSISVIEHVGDLVDGYGTVIAIPDRDSIPEWTKTQNVFATLGIYLRVVEPWSDYKDVAAMPEQIRNDFLNLAIEAP